MVTFTFQHRAPLGVIALLGQQLVIARQGHRETLVSAIKPVLGGGLDHAASGSGGASGTGWIDSSRSAASWSVTGKVSSWPPSRFRKSSSDV